MNIKEAEKATGVSVRNIRFYEQKGLLTPARNRENDYREYSDADIQRLQLIRALRMVDMPLEQIRDVAEGKMSLHDAATAQKEKLEEKIQQLKVATKFCAELAEAEPDNVKEVLGRMDKPENVEHLSKNWKKDFAETIKKLFAMFMYGPMFFVGALISTYVLLLISNWVWAWLENVDFFEQIASLGLISLWCYVGYKSYEKRWWLIKGVLTHIFPAVMLLICNQLFDGKLSLFYGFAFVPYMLLGIGSFGEGDTYVWCLLANMIVFYFGMLLGKIVELCRECWTRRSLRTKSN